MCALAVTAGGDTSVASTSREPLQEVGRQGWRGKATDLQMDVSDLFPDLFPETRLFYRVGVFILFLNCKNPFPAVQVFGLKGYASGADVFDCLEAVFRIVGGGKDIAFGGIALGQVAVHHRG